MRRVRMNAHRFGWLMMSAVFFAPALSQAAEKERMFTNLKPLLTIKGYKGGPGGGVRQVFFSPDGKILATAGDKHIRLWDVKTGKMIRETTIKDDSSGR